jgi:periplasmic copper chaperone A
MDTERNVKFALACSALLAALAGALTLPAVAEDSPNVSVGNLIVEGAFTRPSAPGAKDLEGYFSVINEGSAPDRLVSVDADIADKSELSATHGGGLPDGIEIPAGATVNLAPGENHVQFIAIHHPVKNGDIIHATLGFENAGQIDIGFHVVAPLNGGVSSAPSDDQ